MKIKRLKQKEKNGLLFSTTTLFLFTVVILLSILTIFLNLKNKSLPNKEIEEDNEIINTTNPRQLDNLFENENYKQSEILLKNLPFKSDTFSVELIAIEENSAPKILVKIYSISGKQDFEKWLNSFDHGEVNVIFSQSSTGSFEGSYETENI
jgi:hypothetical protein